MAPRCLPIAQESFVVSFFSDHQWTADSEEASLRSITTMARHGRRVSLTSRCLRVVEGFEDGSGLTRTSCYRRSSDLTGTFFGRRVVLSADNPTYETLLRWSGRLPFFYPSRRVISLDKLKGTTSVPMCTIFENRCVPFTFFTVFLLPMCSNAVPLSIFYRPVAPLASCFN